MSDIRGPELLTLLIVAVLPIAVGNAVVSELSVVETPAGSGVGPPIGSIVDEGLLEN